MATLTLTNTAADPLHNVNLQSLVSRDDQELLFKSTDLPPKKKKPNQIQNIYSNTITQNTNVNVPSFAG